MFKRIGLFLLTNILIMITISVILSVLGVKPYLTAQGMDYKALAIFCLIWGMVGSFISLAISRWSAKMMLGIKVIGPDARGEYQELQMMVARLAQAANLPKTPEVGVYESPEVNAFATGPSKSRSLVAFSTGLLGRMNRDEIEGVAAHEVAHIANGDMVTMTLIQGVANAFVMFFARVIAWGVAQQVKEESRWMVNFAVTIVLEIVFMILAALVTNWFSRQREFRADAGSARIAGRNKMIAALENLQRQVGRMEPEQHASLATLKISSGPSRFGLLFASHPPLQDRIDALKKFA